MKPTRILGPMAVAGLLVAGGMLPMASHSSTHAAHLSGPVKGGTMIDGLYEEPDRLIPNTSSMTYALNVDTSLFSPLFYTDNKGVLFAGLAASIPTVANGGISKDLMTYTFKLRPGLLWSDGQPLDARDVDYSWKTWVNKDLNANTNVGLAQIKSSTVSADNLSITFHLSSPSISFVADWTDQYFPMPAHILSSMTAKQLNTAKFTFQPTVDSGPFIIQSRKAGDNITEVPNPHYYQPGKPYLSKLIFRIIPDQVAITNALSAHEIDASWFLDVSQASTLEHISGYTYVNGLAPNIEQGLLNLKNPILQDVRVRQALEYGLNRQAMATDVWHGAIPLASDEMPSLFSFDPSIKPYPYDPAKAGQLLDAAGWKMGSDGRRHKNGKTLSLRYSTTARNNWRAQDELIALTDYQQLGIDLRIVNYPSDTYFGSILPGGNYDIGEFENNAYYDPDISIYNAFDSSQVPPHGSNWGWYVNPTYDKLITQEEGTADQAQRKVIFSKMQQIMHDQLPSLWYYDPPNIYEYRNTLHNYMPGPYSGECWNTQDWYIS
ncbi:MAG TPA: peptide ABC transporter substrate-binding protein [Chloroflexota bacterium]|nr:peptide ABC transporter substrate-binding protein [Chloroflexota bacterium]